MPPNVIYMYYETAHFSFCFEETLYRTFCKWFLLRFGSFGQAVSEEKN
jgi:hypothetical protein